MMLLQTPRGSLGWLSALLAGGLSAAAFGLAFTSSEFMLTFLSYLAPLPLFMTGLGAGFLPAVAASLLSTTALYTKFSPELALFYFLLIALPTLLFCGLALRYRTGADGKIYWYPESFLMTGIVLYPCLLFLGAMGLTWTADGGLLGFTTAIVQKVLGPLADQLDPSQVDRFKALLAYVPGILPAMLSSSLVFLILVNALVANAILGQQRWNLRESFAWRDLEMPNGLLLAAAGTGLAAAFGPAPYDYAGLNLCFILCLPFFAVGLAVLHAVANYTKAGLFFLIPFYLFLALIPWLALLVMLIGALDQGLHFRQRLARRTLRSDQQGENDD